MLKKNKSRQTSLYDITEALLHTEISVYTGTGYDAKSHLIRTARVYQQIT